MGRVGDSVVLVTAREQGAATTRAATSPTHSVNAFDVNDPANPREFRNFSGVTSILTDQDRGLIYLTNRQGLWILKQRQKQNPIIEKEKMQCQEKRQESHWG